MKFARNTLLSLACAGVLVIISSAPGPSLCQQAVAQEHAPRDDSGDVASNRFEAVSGPGTEEISGAGLLFAGFTAAWVLLLLFVFRIGLLHRRIEQELSELAAQLDADKR